MSSPTPGYYPDPSIPGYIRYWNGSAWVPGTSRPAQPSGEDIAPPPAAAGVVAAPLMAAPPVPRMPEVDESGPMFLDEDPSAPVAEPGEAAAPEAGAGAGAPGADAGSGRGPGPGPGPGAAPWQGFPSPAGPSAAGPGGPSPAGPPASGPLAGASFAGPSPAGPPVAGASFPQAPVAGPAAADRPAFSRTPSPPDSAAPGAQGAPGGRRPGGVDEAPPVPQAPPVASAPRAGVSPPARPVPPGASAPGTQGSPAPAQARAPRAPAAGGGVPWQRQVQELARGGPANAGAPAAPGAAAPGVTGSVGAAAPWKPVADNPFAAAQEQARPGSVAKRLLARLIDSVIVGVAVAAVGVPLGTAAYDHIQQKIDAARRTGETVTVWLIDGTTSVQLAIFLAVVLVTGLLYEVLPTAKWGRTLGKKLFGLKVLDIESQYEPGFWPALRRWLTHTVLGALVIGFLGLAWCLFDRPWRQCWHDKAARTFVARDT